MPRIAISYRRLDTAAICGRIFDRLTQRFGIDNVFMDIDAIPYGVDFRDHIAAVLPACDAVIVLIGPRWIGASGDIRRIDDEADPVRLEVQAALERRIPVIPVLIDNAHMPTVAELPDALKPLAFRNAAEVDIGRDFHPHMDRLIRSMERLLVKTGPPPEIEPEPAGSVEPRPIAPAADRSELRPDDGTGLRQATGAQPEVAPSRPVLAPPGAAAPIGLAVLSPDVTSLNPPERTSLKALAVMLGIPFTGLTQMGLFITQSSHQLPWSLVVGPILAGLCARGLGAERWPAALFALGFAAISAILGAILSWRVFPA